MRWLVLPDRIELWGRASFPLKRLSFLQSLALLVYQRRWQLAKPKGFQASTSIRMSDGVINSRSCTWPFVAVAQLSMPGIAMLVGSKFCQ